MVQGSDRNYQIPHSGYDEELESGKLVGKSSPFPTPHVIEDSDDPDILFDELSNDIRTIPDLEHDKFPLVFAFPPLHHTAVSDSESTLDIFASSTKKAERKKQMQAEVDEPVSPSSSYSGPIIPKRSLPHRPWLIPLPLGYINPPSLQTTIPHLASGLGPTWAQTGLADREPSDHSMDYSGDVGFEVNQEMLVEDRGMPDVVMESSIMHSVMSEDIPNTDGDIYESDVDAHPPLSVYTSDVELEGDSDWREAMMSGGEDYAIPQTVYLSVSDSEEEDVEVPHLEYVPGSGPESEQESDSAQREQQNLYSVGMLYFPICSTSFSHSEYYRTIHSRFFSSVSGGVVGIVSVNVTEVESFCRKRFVYQE